ncbi:MAG: AMP-binding protein, partial [Bdellovibrionales bacterium]|nr:AMP-binding protein [Bdellovibrionales bacterium]
PTAAFRETARIGTVERYQELYEQSIATPEKFWAEQAEAQLHWFRRWDHVMSYDFESIGTTEAPYVQFFKGAKLNACYNCLDRHIESSRRDKAAILWQGEAENDKRQLTYAELHQQVCKFANVLRSHGVTKGSTVTIYMPMIPEVAIAMLACARIGAVHSVVFSAFSADALASRIQDGHCETVITADSGVHAGKLNELKKKVDQALARCPSVRRAFVVNRGNSNISMQAGRDFWWHEEMESMSAESEAEEMDAEDPLFMLYTSGSTGKPKGVLHTTAGYLLYTTLTSKWVFDLRDRDVYWCTADVGWITGHSYLIYGPLSNGATCLMFEGVPTYPEPDRFWKIVDDYKVSVFYTAPTALRALMRLGDSWPEKHDLSSLRLLGTVGEP